METLFSVPPEIVMIADIATLVVGIILIIMGMILKKKHKNWTYLSLLGILTIAIRAIQMILF